MRVLVAEDEPRVADAVARGLRREGVAVDIAGDGAAALFKARVTDYDVVVLDRDLPKLHGDDVCRALASEQPTTKVLMLTASGTLDDLVDGLALGADDYLPKPFNPRELLARIHAVLRRRGPDEAPGGPAQEPQTVSFGEFVLDLATRQLTRNGEPVAITTGEFAVMKAFARHPRVPLSREKLMEMARGREYEAFDRSLDVQISRLRKLIEADPSKPKFIQTVWGLGYVFIPDGNG